MVGRRLSHYQIVDEISRGGMGIVYRAVDVRLNREVALKVLPEELVTDPERRRRFVQEAQATSALDYYKRFVGYWKDGDLDRDGVADAARKIKGS